MTFVGLISRRHFIVLQSCIFVFGERYTDKLGEFVSLPVNLDMVLLVKDHDDFWNDFFLGTKLALSIKISSKVPSCLMMKDKFPGERSFTVYLVIVFLRTSYKIFGC